MIITGVRNQEAGASQNEKKALRGVRREKGKHRNAVPCSDS
jgi:hypothetical protein